MIELNIAEAKARVAEWKKTAKDEGSKTISALVWISVHKMIDEIAFKENATMKEILLEGLVYVLEKRGIKL